MFAFTNTESHSHYESVNRVEERRTTVFLLDLLHCGLSLEHQMLLLLTEFVTCAIRGYTVVGLVHLDIRFANGHGISVRHEHTTMAEHAIRSLDFGCVGWRLLTNNVIFLRVLYRRWVHTNPTLKLELNLSQWYEAKTGQQPFWREMNNIMSEQFSRLGLARELMLPLSFETTGVKFAFVNQHESQRFAALHDSHRQPAAANELTTPQPSTSAAAAQSLLTPTSRPIAPMPPTTSAHTSILAPVARAAVPLRSSHPVLASLLERPPVAPAELGPPPPPPQRASNSDDVVIDVQAFARAAEEVGRQMAAPSRPTQAAADSSGGLMLTPPPPSPPAPIAENDEVPPPQNGPTAQEDACEKVASDLAALLTTLAEDGFIPPSTAPKASSAYQGLAREIKAEPANDGYPETLQQHMLPPPAPWAVKQEPPQGMGHAELGTRLPSPRPGPSGLASQSRKRKMHGLEEEEPEEGVEEKSRKL